MKLFMSILLSVVVLSACSFSNPFTEEESVAMSEENLIEESYVNYRGMMISDEEMVTTIPVKIDADAQYEITRSSYISFYDELTFIETELFTGGDFPKTVEMPEGTTHVRVSFNEANREAIQLNRVE